MPGLLAQPEEQHAGGAGAWLAAVSPHARDPTAGPAAIPGPTESGPEAAVPIWQLQARSELLESHPHRPLCLIIDWTWAVVTQRVLLWATDSQGWVAAMP